jgi:predicted transcriptional regulator
LKKTDHTELSKREREIMNILIEHSQGDVAYVISHMQNPSSYSSIRKILSIMYEKGLLIRKKVGKKYVFSPAISREKAESTALKQLLRTYFDNSLESAVNALLKFHKNDLNKDYLKKLKQIIDMYEEEPE